MKQRFLFITLFMATIQLQAKNVGIGTNIPQKKLSVNGNVMIDQDKNNTGSLTTVLLQLPHKEFLAQICGLPKQQSVSVPNSNVVIK